mmetsp:Transcript_7542/g.23847  ORF Transcript_7542/g.23847 Transcript_7542/m.23847 type:complete len:245 (+) Transcript_7542:92-826(+)
MCSTFRTSARFSNSAPMSRNWRSTCSKFAWSAFVAHSPATWSTLFDRSSSFDVSARRETSFARVLMRSLMWSAVSKSTFLARASFKICTCFATCSVRAAMAFCDTSWLSAWTFLLAWSSLTKSALLEIAMPIAWSWSSMCLIWARVAFCSMFFDRALISWLRSWSREIIFSFSMATWLSTCLTCDSIWSRRRSTSERSSFWDTTPLRSWWKTSRRSRRCASSVNLGCRRTLRPFVRSSHILPTS